jgi:chromosome partitioning protein
MRIFAGRRSRRRRPASTHESFQAGELLRTLRWLHACVEQTFDQGDGMGKVVVFSNQKGGVGKTTLAVLYAFWQREKHGRSVCLIDLDTQGNASKTLRAHAQGVGAAGLFAQETEVKDQLAGEGRLALAPASRNLADVELAKAEVAIPVFRRNVEALSSLFDVVVIDTPPALGLRMSASLIAATDVVCPIELEEYSIDGVTDMLKTVFGVRQRYNPQLRLAGIVLNRFNPHSVRQKAAMRQLVQSFAEYIVPAHISTRSAIPEALSQGVSVWALAKGSARDACLEVREVFELLERRMDAQDVASSGMPS